MIFDIVKTICVILCIYLIGFSVVLLLFNKKFPNIFIILSMSFVIGNCLLSLLLLSLAIINRLNLSLIFITSTFFLSLIIISVKILSFKTFRIKQLIKTKDIILLIFIIVLCLVLLFPTFLEPIYVWDARAIWLIKAKTFFIDNGFPNNFFKIVRYSHKDYPLGFPLLLSIIFRIYGTINEQALKIYLMSYLLNIIFLFIGVLKHFFKNISNSLIILLVLSLFLVDEFILHTMSGYADLPLSLSFMATVASFIFALNSKEIKNITKYLFIGFISSLFAVNIKNEGLSFFIIYILLACIFLIKKCSFKKIFILFHKNFRSLAFYSFILTFLIMPILIWYIIKMKLGFRNDLFNQSISLSFVQYIIRMKVIARSNIEMIFNTSLFGVLFGLCVVSSLAFMFYIFNKVKRKSISLLPGVLVFMQWVVYFILYVLTPHDLNWHLATSLDRLILHLAPSIFILFIYYYKIIFCDLASKNRG